MPPTFLFYKSTIDELLLTFLATKEEELGRINHWGAETVVYIRDMVTRGKTIRGSLVLFGHGMFGADNADITLPFAAGLEMLHTGLLIHDDIMDGDELRRGLPTMHTQIGVNPAMAAGDLAFYMAEELFTITSTPVTAQITRFIAREIQKVCLAQMQDVENKLLTEQEILDLYRYKTARYTFSLPLVVGAMIANATPDVQQQLAALGEHIGILFQIRDDELNKNGDPEVTGKSAGSDAASGKKTLAIVAKNTDTIVTQEKEEAEKIIGSLPIADSYKTDLRAMLEFVCTRTA